MIKAGCLSGYAFGVNSSCFPQLQTGAMPFTPLFANFTHLKKTKLCFQWKQASKTNGYSLAAVHTATSPSEITSEEQNVGGDVQDNCGNGYSEDEKELDPKEAQRRMRIGKANKGKMPWNKGRKHSPETLARIKERTKQAMQNPKVKLKLAQAQHLRATSENKERKEEIREILRTASKARWKRSVLLQTCIIDWKESIAESARSGVDGEDELHWDSYNTLKEDIHQEWLQAIAANKSIQKENTGRRAAKPAEQRQKIAESIKAKWADPEYRKNVMIGRKKTEKSNHLMVPKTRVAMEDKKREKCSRPRKQLLDKNSDHRKQKKARSIHKNKLQPRYSDPQAEAKLQMIKRIRAQRADLELDKREATERAMLLISEALKAAKALESAATVDTSVRTFLLEIRGLIDEAMHSMQIAESGSSTNTSMIESVFNRPTYRATHFVDKSEVADAAIAVSDDNNGVHQISVTKSRQEYENSLLAYKSETYLGSEISRSLYHDSHESSHPISSPKIGPSEVSGYINSCIGSELEGRSDLVSEEDAMFSVERNSVGQIATLIDKQDNPD
ncbi:uncharacterized protein LOC131072080 isoform X1 [Cryptomeria japonica]|uniref:uncharacterized protein LOC131072080 isoform X1 n=1 Tax=Cryptomeria japonica TaxID=3369 RepID=UPI0027DAA9F7|nr:uncharacterized protein LOC131072080 isoform X1 [Cryptomeria japonica]